MFGKPPVLFRIDGIESRSHHSYRQALAVERAFMRGRVDAASQPRYDSYPSLGQFASQHLGHISPISGTLSRSDNRNNRLGKRSRNISLIIKNDGRIIGLSQLSRITLVAKRQHA